MAAQVLHGSGNVTYTNSTGQNVRVVINYLEVNTASTISVTANNSTWSIQLPRLTTYGKSLGYRQSGSDPITAGQNAWYDGGSGINVAGLPLEFALDNGGTFAINGTQANYPNQYNMIIIPEAG